MLNTRVARELTMLLRQRGLSLVELMVGLLLASIISLMAILLFWQQQQAWRLQLARQQIQEEGHLVMQLLRDEAIYAGAHLEDNIFPFFPQADNHRNANNEHSVISFYSQDVTDCLGRNLEAPSTVINQYYVRTNAEGVSALYCRAFARDAWEEVELVRGVELFQARVLVEMSDARFMYLKPEELTAQVEPRTLEVLLVLQHVETDAHVVEQRSYTDPWGEQWWLREGVYGHFFVRVELLNG